MYRKKNREIQIEEVKISLEKLVPENHILRAIDKAIDFSFIYEEVEGLYSEKGRPGIDPVKNRFYSISIRNRLNAPDDKGNRSKRSVSMVYRLFVDRTRAALLHLREKLCTAICRNRHL